MHRAPFAVHAVHFRLYGGTKPMASRTSARVRSATADAASAPAASTLSTYAVSDMSSVYLVCVRQTGGGAGPAEEGMAACCLLAAN